MPNQLEACLVESAWGAVSGLLPVRFPRPLPSRNRCRPSLCARVSPARSTTAAPPRPGPIGGRPAQPNHPHRTRGGGQTRDGSRVHCDLLDEGGARLGPCGLTTATPQHFTVVSRPAVEDRPRSSPPDGGCAPLPAHIHQV